MALIGKFVQLLAAEAPLPGNHFGRIALRDDLEEIHQLGADRAFAGPERIRAHRHARHVFDAGTDNDLLRARQDPLGGEVHRLLAGATEAIHRRSGNFDGEARDQGSGARDIHALFAGLGDAARDNVVDLEHELGSAVGLSCVHEERRSRALDTLDRRVEHDDAAGEDVVLVGLNVPGPYSDERPRVD